ncbi:hypothetical protein [Halanaerobium salsuginis]|jgi:hypothetical protein|nr:hypothetical protein [Halanaerobium salsuginis]
MFNTLFSFFKSIDAEGRRIESNLQSVKEKQLKHDAYVNLKHY